MEPIEHFDQPEPQTESEYRRSVHVRVVTNSDRSGQTSNPTGNSEHTDDVAGEILTAMLAYVRSRIVVSLAIGLLTALGFWWVGVQYWWLWGSIVGITSLVPFLPVAAGLIPALIVAYFQFNDLTHPLYLTIVFMIVQMLDGLVLSPLIQGKMVGLHPITTFLVLLIASACFGFIGLLVAIPVAIALKIIGKRYYTKWPMNGQQNGRTTAKHIRVEEIKTKAD